LGLAAILLVLCHLGTRRRRSKSRVAILIGKMLTPLAAIVLALVLDLFFHLEVNVAGSFAWLVYSTLSVVKYLAFAWLFWLAVLTAFEWMILSPRIPDDSLNANLMRLSARLIGFLGALFLLALGAHDLGIPVVGVLAGLGFGGLAVALAIRPTLENLVAGVILFMDKPVQVGDFCTFGEHTGFVENIGIRTTKIRALDRTLISIPNATFADMELVNWAQCDTILILTQIGLRYETTPDQLRHVLAKLREMLFAHPKIQRSTVRVRFVGYGASSLDVQIRVYALTQEWNEFYAIREDVLLRVNQIVAESGTSFAFPSQTLYFGRDDGLDRELSEAAKQQVADWRRRGALPFPDPAAARIDDLAGTLDYPPQGSVEEYRPHVAEAQESERLSESPPPDQSEDDSTTEKR
jgi:MscS family membrane protein